MNTEIPFVGLHAHSTFSVFDGFGFPSEHMDRAHAHGMDALALTDHGNMNGLSYQILHAQKSGALGLTRPKAFVPWGVNVQKSRTLEHKSLKVSYPSA